jgi:hypothetical protein
VSLGLSRVELICILGSLDRSTRYATSTSQVLEVADESGKVWDVTDFLDEHPGGAEIIL